MAVIYYKEQIEIAAQLHTVREFTQTPEAIKESLHKVKQMGYNAVQVSKVGEIGDAELKAIADHEGLKICATHVPYSKLLNDFEQVVEQHRIWECEYVGVGSMPNEYRSEKGFHAFAREASDIAAMLKGRGLQFIYHNHNFEFAKLGNRSGMDILFEETDPDAFHFELDVYWVQAGGGDPVEWIRKCENRLKVVHLKDMGVTLDRHIFFAEVGEGNMNFPAIMKACTDIGVEWGAVEQDTCPGNPFDSLELSLRNLRSWGFQD